jgi:hypothetical protein
LGESQTTLAPGKACEGGKVRGEFGDAGFCCWKARVKIVLTKQNSNFMNEGMVIALKW